MTLSTPEPVGLKMVKGYYFLNLQSRNNSYNVISILKSSDGGDICKTSKFLLLYLSSIQALYTSTNCDLNAILHGIHYHETHEEAAICSGKLSVSVLPQLSTRGLVFWCTEHLVCDRQFGDVLKLYN